MLQTKQYPGGGGTTGVQGCVPIGRQISLLFFPPAAWGRLGFQNLRVLRKQTGEITETKKRTLK